MRMTQHQSGPDRSLRFSAASARLLAFLALAFGLGGCGGGSTNFEVTGKLTKKGVLYTPPQTTQVTLVFRPEKKDSEQTYVASFVVDKGTYSVELPPGKYTTNLLLFDHAKKPPAKVAIRPDFSKTVYDLTSAKTLDLEIEP
jgi:hypothetical protein